MYARFIKQGSYNIHIFNVFLLISYAFSLPLVGRATGSFLGSIKLAYYSVFCANDGPHFPFFVAQF